MALFIIRVQKNNSKPVWIKRDPDRCVVFAENGRGETHGSEEKWGGIALVLTASQKRPCIQIEIESLYMPGCVARG